LLVTEGVRTAEALLPIAGIASLLLVAMVVFVARCLALGRPRTPYVEARGANPVWKWLMEWWIWTWGPVERVCIGLRIPPDAISVASALATGAAAWFLAQGALAVGGWTYIFGASLDLVDGRVARALGVESRAGAFLDSTLDRLCELLVFGALALHFRASPILVAVLGATAASLLVSYTRARGESLGVRAEARTGGMQRAERVVLTGVPCALSPVFALVLGPAGGDVAVGSALSILAVVTSFTALHRFVSIYRSLRGPAAGEGALGNVRWLDNARRRQRLGP
jgi:phosphatidylglycerophosphate synthase